MWLAQNFRRWHFPLTYITCQCAADCFSSSPSTACSAAFSSSAVTFIAVLFYLYVCMYLLASFTPVKGFSPVLSLPVQRFGSAFCWQLCFLRAFVSVVCDEFWTQAVGVLRTPIRTIRKIQIHFVHRSSMRIRVALKGSHLCWEWQSDWCWPKGKEADLSYGK